ncbi:hypothetical protein F8M41_018788 [Gigaspora margarita]|uniref:Uncharacterized protein n=1 Tax=Gigaspora margarita TaxID=4874 RepID=A0A8H4AL82_GIGMA|nr:hypothetical protein F8M41_018788 [Gigaspora margarita]
MHRQLEDLHINQTKFAKAIKKISRNLNPLVERQNQNLIKKKKSGQSKRVNAHIISDESSSDSSDSKNSMNSSKNEPETNTLACSWNESESSSSETSESSNSESDSEKYEINATKKK